MSSESEWGEFKVSVKIVQPLSQMWFSVSEQIVDGLALEVREVARFLNADDAQSYAHWRNTVLDGLHTCPDCGFREPTDPGCSNCRDGQ